MHKNVLIYTIATLLCSFSWTGIPAVPESNEAHTHASHQTHRPRAYICSTSLNVPQIGHSDWGKLVILEANGLPTIYADNNFHADQGAKPQGGNCMLTPLGSCYWDWNLSKTRHNTGITIAAVQDLIERADVDIVVLSRGMDLVLQVPDATVQYLKSLGKEIIVQQTEDAIQTYNRLVQAGKRVAALIHSTC